MDSVHCVAVLARKSGRVIGTLPLGEPTFRLTQARALLRSPRLIATVESGVSKVGRGTGPPPES